VDVTNLIVCLNGILSNVLILELFVALNDTSSVIDIVALDNLFRS